jgi:cytoskeletal protein CcmA (bactofilin family)
MGGRCASPSRKSKKKILGSIFTKEEQGISLIGEGLSVVGTLNFDDRVVRLDGHLEGEIFGRGVLIMGREGRFHGEMRVRTLILCGRIEGTVIAYELAHIKPSGKLFGRIQASQLIIEEGGMLEGQSVKLETSTVLEDAQS